MSSVILRILSGIHIGAEIELSPGTWVVGRDDSCDIILSDASVAARHAALQVTDSGELEFEGLDGTVLTAGETPPEGGMLVAGEIYRLGGVIFAWGPEDAPEEFWRGVEQSLAALSAPRIQAEDTPEKTSPETPEASPSAGGDPSPDKADEAVPEEGESEGAEKAGGRSVGSRTAVVVLTVILAAAVVGGVVQHRRADQAPSGDGWVSIVQQEPERTSSFLSDVREFLGFSEPRPEEEAQRLQAHLQAEGFRDVTASASTAGSGWLFSGSVKDDAERARLVQLARSLSRNAVIDVSVDSDYTGALEAAFNTAGFWPAVKLVKGAGGALDGLEVSAYMLSAVIEERAFENALANVPEITAPASGRRFVVRRVIRHRDYLEGLFAKLFTAQGLRDVKVEYRSGDVRFLTVLTPERRAALETVVGKVHAESAVPVRIEVVNEKGAAAVAAASAPRPAAPADPMRPAFVVKAVSGGVLKFITLSTGEKVFEGGTLPGGFVLESISFDQLLLSKNGRRIKHPLRIGK